VNKDQKRGVIEGAALVIFVTAVTVATTGCSSDPADKHTKRTTNVAASKTAKPKPTPAPTGPTEHTLKSTAAWGHISLKVGDFRRGSTDKSGVPEDTDYVRFAVTLNNDTDDPFNLRDLAVSCGTREVYDFTDQLEGVPTIHVLPGKDMTWDLACVQAKDEKDFQVEFNAQAGDERTAIFSGEVK